MNTPNYIEVYKLWILSLTLRKFEKTKYWVGTWLSASTGFTRFRRSTLKNFFGKEGLFLKNILFYRIYTFLFQINTLFSIKKYIRKCYCYTETKDKDNKYPSYFTASVKKLNQHIKGPYYEQLVHNCLDNTSIHD